MSYENKTSSLQTHFISFHFLIISFHFLINIEKNIHYFWSDRKYLSYLCCLFSWYLYSEMKISIFNTWIFIKCKRFYFSVLIFIPIRNFKIFIKWKKLSKITRTCTILSVRMYNRYNGGQKVKKQIPYFSINKIIRIYK